MNINMLRDADDDVDFWSAACTADPAGVWRGAPLWCSKDGGATYLQIGAFTTESVIGRTTTALGDYHGGNTVDEQNRVNVKMRNGALSSTTYDGLLAGAMTLVIGDEILFARDAEVQADGSYDVWGLLRGRRGSEYAMGSHTVGERVILVDFSAMLRVSQETADLNVPRKYKAGALADAVAVDFTNEGCGRKPYSPVLLGGGRNAAGDVILTAVRRNRKSGEWRDSVDVPMSEATEAYEIDVFTDGTYSTVKRTLTGLTSPTGTYLAADQTADFGGLQSPVYWGIAQLSAVVGRGHMAYGAT